MVSNVMSFTNNGLRDWILQRVSAIVLAVFTVYLLLFLILHPGLQYTAWSALFTCTYMRVLSVLALIALLIHAYIGMWTVLTDYVKPVALRVTLEVLVYFSLVAYLIWGIAIVWGA